MRVAIPRRASALLLQQQESTMKSQVAALVSCHDARTVGRYYKGTATFTVAKGGLMYEATVSGQKFSYTPAS